MEENGIARLGRQGGTDCRPFGQNGNRVQVPCALSSGLFPTDPADDRIHEAQQGQGHKGIKKPQKRPPA
jgi:hypothetical protein